MVATAIPELEDPAQAKAALAQLGEARQFHEAASFAAKAMALWPEDGDFRAERAKHLLAAGALLEAESVAREALLAEASDAQKEAAWIILADALIRQERAADAREALREACFAMPGSVALQARRGHQAAQVGDYPEAIDAYQAACDLAPEREALHLGLLSGLWMAKRYALGSAAAARAVEQFPESAVMLQQQANFLLAEGRAAEAAMAAREAVNLNPSGTDSNWVLVDVLWRQDRYNEAFRMLEAALDRSPTDVFLLQQLVRLAPAVFREDAIPTTHRRAIELGEMPRGVWEVLIRSLIKEDAYEEAGNTARRALLVLAAAPEFTSLLAEIELLKGVDQQAIALDIASALGVEANALAVQIALISGLLNLQRWDEATRLLETLRYDTPDEPELLLRFGIALTGKGAVEDAVAILSVLIEKHPDNIPAWEALCDAYRAAKQIKNAIAAYRRLEVLGASMETMRRVQVKLFGEQVY
jgi:predicted Zn-dependent protease